VVKRRSSTPNRRGEKGKKRGTVEKDRRFDVEEKKGGGKKVSTTAQREYAYYVRGGRRNTGQGARE